MADSHILGNLETENEDIISHRYTVKVFNNFFDASAHSSAVTKWLYICILNMRYVNCISNDVLSLKFYYLNKI